MSRRALAIVAASLVAAALAPALPAVADPVWQPGTPPLTTPWTHLVGPDNALPEYPRPQLTRPEWKNLNGVWEFAGAAEGEAPPIGQSLDERILVPYPVESALSGIQRTEERMWYRRTFDVPSRWRGQRLILNFGAVDYDTRVWVNGKQVTTHRGGYDSFSVDITSALNKNGSQEIVVGVEDLTDKTWQPVGKQRQVPDRGIFYTGSSGIWQTVWLEPVQSRHITKLDMTPRLADSSLRLTARSNIEGTVEAVAYDNGRIVGRVRGPANQELKVPVPNAKLWSPDSPFLYDLKVTLFDGRTKVDEVGSYFGMREIGTKPGADGKLRMTLNGKILFHMSTLDQGFWPDGIHTAPTDAALRFDLEQHKVLGFNTVRKHIKVEPDRWYYHADKLGLLVWQDMPSMKTVNEEAPPAARTQFERELHTMVEQHKSWTSIVVWVPFNEGWGEWSREETGRIADEVKAQDPSRLVNAHSGVNC
ncbi:MAG: glycoside hydrolase family 2, partial [Actinomycetota bacterium]|nr:glycoside hydrolase family 2 [Actinomycetota bacterium]